MIFRVTPKLYRLIARQITEIAKQPDTSKREQILEMETTDTQMILRFTPIQHKNKISVIHSRLHVWVNQTLVSSDFDPDKLRKKLP